MEIKMDYDDQIDKYYLKLNCGCKYCDITCISDKLKISYSQYKKIEKKINKLNGEYHLDHCSENFYFKNKENAIKMKKYFNSFIIMKKMGVI
jgi:hypothetical protein